MSVFLRPKGIIKKGLVGYWKMDEGRNLFKYSQDFDNAAWSKDIATITPNAVVAPDGTLTADKLVENNTTGNHQARQNVVVEVGKTYTMSAYAKKGERRFAVISATLRGDWPATWFDLEAGVLGQVAASMTARIEDMGDGWYRISATMTATVTSATVYFGIGDANFNWSYLGNNISGIYLWGAQFELGTSPSVYFKTTDKQSVIDYCPYWHDYTRRNILNYSQEFDNVYWSKTNCSVIANNTIAPDGTLTADKLTSTTGESAINTPDINLNGNYIFSIWLRSDTPTSIKLVYYTGSSYPDITCNVTTEWQRFILPMSGAITRIYIGGNSSFTSGEIIYAWGAQLELINNDNYIPSAYQVTTANASINNILKYSETFDNVQWGKTRTSIIPNTAQDPLGNLTADKLILDNTLAEWHLTTQSLTGLPDNIIYVFSIYLKKEEKTWAVLKVRSKDNSTKQAYFDLTNGIVGTVTSGTLYSNITPVSNGYYRCAIGFNILAGATTPDVGVYIANSNGDMIVDGDGVSGIYMWGAQLEILHSSSYQATTTVVTTPEVKVRSTRNLLMLNQANACEDGTTTKFSNSGYGLSGTASTLSVESSISKFGSKCLKVVTTGTVNEGARTATYNVIPSKTYTASMYIKGTIGNTLRFFFRDDNAASGDVHDITCDGTWQRVNVTLTMSSTAITATINIRVTTATVVTFYVDGLQLEEGPTLTDWTLPYADGVLGSGSNPDTNDPAVTPEGYSFATDKYINVGNIGAEMRTLQMVFYNNAVINKDTTIQSIISIDSVSDYRGAIYLGASTSLLTNEIITLPLINDSGSARCGWCDSSAGIPVGWHILDLVWDGSKYRIILDGQEKPVTIVNTPGIMTTSYVRLGAGVGTGGSSVNYFNGKITPTLMYSRSLTDAELAKNREVLKREMKLRGVELPPYVMVRTGLVAEYRFDDAKNLLTVNQSSVESGTTGFVSYNSATISMDTTESYVGRACLKCVTPNVGSSEGVTFASSTNIKELRNYAYSCYVKGTIGATLRLQTNLNAAGGGYLGTFYKDITLTSTWQRCIVSFMAPATASLFYGYLLTPTQQAVTFYVDGLQLEYGGIATDWQLGGGDKQTLRDYAEKGKYRNLLTLNQSNGCESGATTGFSSYYGTPLTAESGQSYQGNTCLKVACPGNIETEGFSTGAKVASLVGAKMVTVSAFIKGSGTAHLIIMNQSGTWRHVLTQPIPNTWQRWTLTGQMNAADTGVIVGILTSTQQAVTFYVDNLQIEEGPTATDWQEGNGDFTFPTAVMLEDINLLTPNQANACEDGTTTGFTATHGSSHISVESAEKYVGSKSLKVITDGVVSYEGVYPSATIEKIKPGITYTMQARVKGPIGAALYLQIYSNGGTYEGGNSILTCDGTWQLMTVSKLFAIASSHGLEIASKITTDGTQAIAYYVDGLQLQESSTATAWCLPQNHGQLGNSMGSDANDPTWSSEGLTFIDDYVDCGDINFHASNEVTLTAIIKPTALGGSQGILGKNYNTKPYFSLYTMGTDLVWEIADSSNYSATITSSLGLVNNNIYLIEIKQIGTLIEIYVNKVLVKTDTLTISFSASNNNNKFNIGRLGALGYPFIGMAFTVLGYKKKLSVPESEQNYRYFKYELAKRGILLP